MGNFPHFLTRLGIENRSRAARQARRSQTTDDVAEKGENSPSTARPHRRTLQSERPGEATATAAAHPDMMRPSLSPKSLPGLLNWWEAAMSLVIAAPEFLTT